MRFEIRVLGPVETTDNETLIATDPRTTHLLALLASAGGGWVANSLLELDFWPEKAPQSPRSALQVAVSKARRLFEPVGAEVIESRPGSYRLRAEHCAVDLQVWFDLIAAARRSSATNRIAEAVEHYARARAMWRGDAFSGVTGSAHLDGERHRLDQACTDVDLDEARALLAARLPAESVRVLAMASRREPLREDVAIATMSALNQSARTAEALTVAADFRTALREEIGASPSHLFDSTERDLLGGIGAQPGPSTSMPIPAAWRRKQCGDTAAEIARSLEGGPTSMLAVNSPPRYGLSTFLARLADDVAELLPDAGVHHLAHRSGAEHSIARILRPAESTGSEEQEHSLALDKLGTLAEASPQVIVIDDADELDPWSRRLINRMARRAVPRDVAVVIGLRNGEEIDREWLDDVDVGISLDKLGPGDAKKTLASGDPTLSAAELHRGATRLLEWCGGEPRLLLAGARTLVSAGPDAELPTPRAAGERIAVQLDGLDPEIRAVLRQAAVLGESIDCLLLSAVSAKSTVETIAMMGVAAGQGLVARSAAPGWWAFPDQLTRDVIASEVETSEAQQLHAAAASWLLDHAVGTARAAHHLVHALPLVDIGATVEAAVAGGHEQLTEGNYDEAAFLFASAAELTATLRAGDEARLNQAHALERIGSLREADELYNSIQARSDETTPDLLAASALGGSGHSNRVGGQDNRRRRLGLAYRRLDGSHPLADEVAAEFAIEQLTSRNLPLDDELRDRLATIGDDDESTGQLAALRVLLSIKELHDGATIDAARRLTARASAPEHRGGRDVGAALATATYVALVTGEWSQADEWLDELDLVGRSSGAPKSRWHVAAFKAALADARGDTDEADRLATSAFQIGCELDIDDAEATLGLHHMARAFRDGSLAPFVAALADVAPRLRRPVWAAFRGLAELDSGQDDLAVHELDEAIAELEHGYDVHRPPALALTCLLGARLGRADQVLPIAAELEHRVGGWIFLGYGGPLLGPVDWFRAEHADAAGHAKKAAALRAAARDRCAQVGARGWRDRFLRPPLR